MQTKVKDVINDPAFKGYGRLIFPADIKIEDNLTLENIEEILPWYSEINPKRTVEIVNYMKFLIPGSSSRTMDVRSRGLYHETFCCTLWNAIWWNGNKCR